MSVRAYFDFDAEFFSGIVDWGYENLLRYSENGLVVDKEEVRGIIREELRKLLEERSLMDEEKR